MSNTRRMQQAAAGAAGSAGYELWMWGSRVDNSGSTGSPDFERLHASSPIQITKADGKDSNWLVVSGGGYMAAAITQDYKLFTWGDATNGALGDGQTTVHTSSPVQVGVLSDWLKVQASHKGCFAIKTDGTLWGWGSAANGRLGDGTVVNKSSPIQIGSATNWVSVDACAYETFAINSAGKLYAWGNNSDGTLGLGNVTLMSVPTQIGTLTTWVQVSTGISNSIARKTDGTVWAWGRGVYGTSGNSNTINCSSPVQVGSLTTWANIHANFRTMMGVTTAGALWSWGRNEAGEMGIGTITGVNEKRSSPVQVGSLTDWDVTGGATSTIFARKTDGTVWAWGNNWSGQCAQGIAQNTHFSSPVQIGSDTNWVFVGGSSHGNIGFGLKDPNL